MGLQTEIADTGEDKTEREREGGKKSKKRNLNNNTQSANSDTFPLPSLGDSCSTWLFPGDFDGFFPLGGSNDSLALTQRGTNERPCSILHRNEPERRTGL